MHAVPALVFRSAGQSECFQLPLRSLAHRDSSGHVRSLCCRPALEPARPCPVCAMPCRILVAQRLGRLSTCKNERQSIVPQRHDSSEPYSVPEFPPCCALA